jgi:hypothetical protein
MRFLLSGLLAAAFLGTFPMLAQAQTPDPDFRQPRHDDPGLGFAQSEARTEAGPGGTRSEGS